VKKICKNPVNTEKTFSMYYNEKPGCVLWHIFPTMVLAFLRNFLIEVCGFKGPGNPVHSQLIYITPGLLQRFFEQYHILPYTIRQYPGEAVFIPAYCAHQVANLVDGIKITSDFISITNIQRTQRLVDEFQQQRLSSSGDDVLLDSLVCMGQPLPFG
jgi:JmjC domain, hydroxylase